MHHRTTRPLRRFLQSMTAGLVVGAGLGDVIVNALQGLQIGASIEGGLAVVIIAIYLDRVSAALGGQNRGNPAWWPRRKARIGADEAEPVAA